MINNKYVVFWEDKDASFNKRLVYPGGKKPYAGPGYAHTVVSVNAGCFSFADECEIAVN